jgi:3-oxoacyl-[acyl-carrier-protein] synthase III
MAARGNVVIESIGVYLPEKVVSTRETLEACKINLSFPIEDLTGIRSARFAGDTEFAIDLSKKAILDCLAYSRYEPKDIDLLVCGNISRYDGAGFRYSVEPTTAIKLKKYFGFERALAFDVSNACPGMFTAIKVVESFIRAGTIRRGMVVSGEYITHMTRTAQLEIENLRDPRLACLTLGDSGAALILEEAADNRVGFHEIDIYTVGRYSDLCIGKASAREHGGAIMYTQPVKLAPVAVEHATSHSVSTVRKHGWSPELVQHLIPHQTSRKTLADMSKKVGRLLGRDGWAESITINNLQERGNTATTSHFVAALDHIRKGTIKTGDNVIFSIAGSGLTVGTALYTFDDLPERLRRTKPLPPPRDATPAEETPAARPMPRGVRVQSVGTVPASWDGQRETVELAKVATEQCLARTPLDRADIGLLIFSGVYRTDFLYEPAIAALIAGAIDLNAQVKTQGEKKSLAFDVFNSSLGFLNACHVADHMIGNGTCEAALVVASEVEHNVGACPEGPRGVVETGSAVLLSRGDGVRRGFGSFVFKYRGEYLDDFEVCGIQKQGTSFVHIKESGRLEEHYLECIPPAVEEVLRQEELELSDVRWILPPQRSAEFVTRLSERLGLEREKFVDVTRPDGDLFTSSFAHSFQHLIDQKKTKPGDIGLLIDVGAGIQVGCAAYYF